MTSSNQFPVKQQKPKEYFLWWICGKIKQQLTGTMPYAILQTKKKELEKQPQFKSGKIVIATKVSIAYE